MRSAISRWPGRKFKPSRSRAIGPTSAIRKSWANSTADFRGLLGPFGSVLFADFLFDFALPRLRNPGPHQSVKQIQQEEDSRHPFVVEHREQENDCDHEEPGKRARRPPG